MVLLSGRLAAEPGRTGSPSGRRGDDAGGVLRALPRAEQAPRHDLLLVDAPAAAREAPPRPRPLWLLPYADDIVDDLGRRARRRRASGAARPSATASSPTSTSGASDDPVLKAVVHTVRAFDIDPDCFRRFLRSMAMDLTVADVRDVRRPARLHGRLGRGHRRDDAADPRAVVARRRDRPRPRPRHRLPAHELPARRRRGPRPGPGLHPPGGPAEVRRRDRARRRDGRRPSGATSWPSRSPARRGSTRSADLGIALLPAHVGPCIRGARLLYAGILDRIEAADYDVFSRRVRVPTWRKLAVAARLHV